MQINTQNITNKHDSSNVTYVTNSNELTIDTVTTKKYHTHLDRFRRKPFESKDMNSPKVVHELINNLKLNDVQDKAIYTDETKYDDNDIDNSMEKLRVDEATRTKIFHDFSTTVSKYPDKNLSVETSDWNQVASIDETADINSQVIDLDMDGTEHEDIFGNDNESSSSLTDRVTSFPYHLPTTSVLKTMKPRIDGKS